MRIQITIAILLAAVAPARAQVPDPEEPPVGDLPDPEAKPAPPAEPPAPAPRVQRSRLPEYISLGVTGGLVVATGAALWYHHVLTNRLVDDNWVAEPDHEEHARTKAAAQTWKRRGYALFGTTIVSSLVTAYLFTRHNAPAFDVNASGSGAVVTYAGRF